MSHPALDPEQILRAQEILSNHPELQSAVVQAWYLAQQLSFDDKLVLRPYLMWVYDWENLRDTDF